MPQDAVYRLEVMLDNGSTRPVNLQGLNQVKFCTRFEFPNVGRSDSLYVATNENKIYRWDSETSSYRVVGSDYNDITIIDGGGASNGNT